MKARSAKAKGSGFERDIARELRRTGLDKNAQRMVLSGGAPGFVSDIKTDLPIHFECKRQEKTKFREWFAQAEGDCSQIRIPVVVWRGSHDRPFVFFDFNDFLELLTYAVEGGYKGKLPFGK